MNFIYRKASMLSHKCRHLLQAVQRSSPLLNKQFAAAASTDVNPFHFQDILEMEKKPDIPWKKLTSMIEK